MYKRQQGRQRHWQEEEWEELVRKAHLWVSQKEFVALYEIQEYFGLTVQRARQLLGQLIYDHVLWHKSSPGYRVRKPKTGDGHIVLNGADDEVMLENAETRSSWIRAQSHIYMTKVPEGLSVALHEDIKANVELELARRFDECKKLIAKVATAGKVRATDIFLMTRLLDCSTIQLNGPLKKRMLHERGL